MSYVLPHHKFVWFQARTEELGLSRQKTWRDEGPESSWPAETWRKLIMPKTNLLVSLFQTHKIKMHWLFVAHACVGRQKLFFCGEVQASVSAETGNANVVAMKCDLSDLESVQNFCKQFLAQESALHILVNNAGTVDSLEQCKVKETRWNLGFPWLGVFVGGTISTLTKLARKLSAVISYFW